ncbi:uncharacterized protein LOC143183000 [Calliopsis andreniformis]|uniref:uncharacterized protein LOC143183000 n=1 Tax=Calliopsis andreniformis TaxID=337506 RepID=UPI003FCCD0EC
MTLKRYVPELPYTTMVVRATSTTRNVPVPYQPFKIIFHSVGVVVFSSIARLYPPKQSLVNHLHRERRTISRASYSVNKTQWANLKSNDIHGITNSFKHTTLIAFKYILEAARSSVKRHINSEDRTSFINSDKKIHTRKTLPTFYILHSQFCVLQETMQDAKIAKYSSTGIRI